MNKNFSDAFLSALILAFMPLLTKTLYSFGCNPISSAFYRMFFAIFLMLGLTLFVNKENLKITKKNFFYMLIASLCFCANVLCIYNSYNYINSSSTTAIHYMFPIIIFIASSVITREKPEKIEVFCVIMSTVALLLFFDLNDLENLIGVTLAFMSALFYATYSLILDFGDLKNIENSKIMFFITLIGSLFIFSFTKFTNQKIFTGFVGRQWLFVIFFSWVLMSATFLYQRSVMKIGAKYTSIVMTFEPIFTLIIGFLFLEESFSFKSIISIILILISNNILIKSKK